jgi:CRISPR-associated endonuclease Csn1
MQRVRNGINHGRQESPLEISPQAKVIFVVRTLFSKIKKQRRRSPAEAPPGLVSTSSGAGGLPSPRDAGQDADTISQLSPENNCAIKTAHLKGKNMNGNTSPDFFNGLVFGFDVGTGSIGYAVRRGAIFLDVGVLICDSEGSDLEGRRNLRRQRRTLRSRKARRESFAEELRNLGLKKPERMLSDPVTLRLRALTEDKLAPDELYAALTHLFKRRGYTKVPWANVEAVRKNGETAEREEGETQTAISKLEEEMKSAGCKHPCQLLDHRRKNLGKQPQSKWGRNFPWGRQMLEDEFRAIVTAQKDFYPELATHAEKLLHGNTRKVTREVDGKKREFHVYFKTDKEKKPGVLGVRWPKFENRSPGLDALEPFRKDAKTGAWIPQHTMRRDNLLFKEWQLEVALKNFKVKRRKVSTGKSKQVKFDHFLPPPPALAALRKLWNERGHLWAEDLQEWAKDYEGQFELHYPDRDLTPRNNLGRASFSKFGMATIHKAIAEAREKHDAAYVAWEQKFREKNKDANEEDIVNGYAKFLTQQANSISSAQGAADNSYARTVAPPPVLILPGETPEVAFQRYLNSIRDPQVRHRVELFARELRRLMKLHSQSEAPDFIVIELGRELMMNQEQKDAKEAKDKERRDERDKAAQILRDMGFAPDADNIKKFLLAQEAGWRCPFTLQSFTQSDFSKLTITQLVQAENKPSFVKEARSMFPRLEVEHLVPRSPVVCNEWFNLTVTLNATNAQKRKRTPFQWLFMDKDGLPSDLDWERIRKNAEERFNEKSLKYQVFTSPDGAKLVEENAKKSIQQNAYIARCLREACLIIFGKEWLDWTDGAGRDPRLLTNNRASKSYLTTNGVITARLRGAWHLTEILWPKPERLNDAEWDKLTEEEKSPLKAKYKVERELRALKNRQDHRHHAIDAMVISCAVPWHTFKVRTGNQQPDDGLCEVDAETGAITKIWNPVFNDYGYEIKKAAEAKAALLLKYSADRTTDLLRHHKSSQRHKQCFDATLYGRREIEKVKTNGKAEKQIVFVARKRLLDLYESHLLPGKDGYIFSDLLRKHIEETWKVFKADISNWNAVRTDWVGIYRVKQSEIEKHMATCSNKRTLAGLRKSLTAATDAIAKLEKMEAGNWTVLLKYIDQAQGSSMPKTKFPEQFVTKLKHPIYHTPITSVKVTAQSKGDENFLPICEATSPAARSGTYVMRKQKDKYREMRVYTLEKRGRAGFYVCWLTLPWYGKFDSQRKEFGKVSADFMPPECKGAKFKRAFRKNQVVCFKNDRHLESKGVKPGESYRIVQTEVLDNALARIFLLPAHFVKQTKHPITGAPQTIDLIAVSLNDFMTALEPKSVESNPPSNELPHPPSVKPQS